MNAVPPEPLFRGPVINKVVAEKNLEGSFITEVCMIQLRQLLFRIERVGAVEQPQRRFWAILAEIVINSVHAIRSRQIDKKNPRFPAGEFERQLIARRRYRWVGVRVRIEQDVNRSPLEGHSRQVGYRPFGG